VAVDVVMAAVDAVMAVEEEVDTMAAEEAEANSVAVTGEALEAAIEAAIAVVTEAVPAEAIEVAFAAAVVDLKAPRSLGELYLFSKQTMRLINLVAPVPMFPSQTPKSRNWRTPWSKATSAPPWQRPR
jgi:citrate lyase synthetase